MATSLGQLTYTLTLNDEGFQEQVAEDTDKVQAAGDEMGGTLDETSEKGGLLGGTFSGMAAQFVAGAAIFTAGQKVFDTIKTSIDDAVQAAKDWQTEQAQMQAGLKSTNDASGETADSLTELANKTQDSTSISREAVMTGENMLLTFTNIGKNIFPQTTQAVADMATRMGGGAVPTMQQMNQTALQLGKALNDPATGMTMLRREGVTFTAQQQAQIKSLEAHNDLLGAQKIVLAEVAKEFGGSASAAAQTYQGQVDALKNKFNDLVGEGIQKAIGALEQFAIFLVEHKPLLAAVAGAVTGLAIAIGIALVSALYAVIAPAIAAVLAMYPLILVGAAIGLLAYEIITHWNDLKMWFGEFWRTVKQDFDDFVAFLKPFAEATLALILLPILPALLMWKYFHTQIQQGFTDTVNLIKAIFTPIVDFISGVINMAVDAVKKPFEDAANWLIDAGANIIKGLVQGIENGIGDAVKAVEHVSEAIINTAKSALNIHSPSEVFAEMGQNISLGLSKGIEGAGNAPVQSISQLTNTIVQSGASAPAAAGSSGNTYQIQQVILQGAEAVDEFFNIGNRNMQLELNGMAPLAGTVGAA